MLNYLLPALLPSVPPHTTACRGVVAVVAALPPDAAYYYERATGTEGLLPLIGSVAHLEMILLRAALRSGAASRGARRPLSTGPSAAPAPGAPRQAPQAPRRAPPQQNGGPPGAEQQYQVEVPKSKNFMVAGGLLLFCLGAYGWTVKRIQTVS